MPQGRPALDLRLRLLRRLERLVAMLDAPGSLPDRLEEVPGRASASGSSAAPGTGQKASLSPAPADAGTGAPSQQG